MYVCQSVTGVVYGRVVEDASGPVITNFRYVSPSARSAAAARPACLYGTTDNASLLTNAKVRLYNCDSAYDVFSIGVWSVAMVDAIGSSLSADSQPKWYGLV